MEDALRDARDPDHRGALHVQQRHVVDRREASHTALSITCRETKEIKIEKEANFKPTKMKSEKRKKKRTKERLF